MQSSRRLQCLSESILEECYLDRIDDSEDTFEFEKQSIDRPNPDSRHSYMEEDDFEEQEQHPF